MKPPQKNRIELAYQRRKRERELVDWRHFESCLTKTIGDVRTKIRRCERGAA